MPISLLGMYEFYHLVKHGAEAKNYLDNFEKTCEDFGEEPIK